MQQAEDDSLRQLLDQDMESIRSLLYAVDSSHSDNIVADVETSIAKLDTLDKADREYDKVVRELAFERRAKPKDRTKTEEEIALEEKQALEMAERRRLKRMRGEEDSDREEESGRRKRRRQVGGDDLEDDFYDEGDILTHFGIGLEEDTERTELKSSNVKNLSVEEGKDHTSDGKTSDEDEDSDGSESRSEGLGSDEEEEVQDLVPAHASMKTKTGTVSEKELPFTFSCPGSHEEFLDILDGIEDKDVPTVVQRIRTLYHPSLAEDNKFKLQVSIIASSYELTNPFYQRLSGVLLDHVLHITRLPTPRFTLLSRLIPHLCALAKAYPSESAQYFVDKLSLMQRNLKLGLSRGATDPQTKTWPGLPELSLLRVIGLLWSASDLNHQVVSPARLLMGAYLGLCRIRSLDDIGSGLFICTLWLQFEELSKRFVPEVVNFLANTVLHLAPHGFKEASSVPGFFPSPDFQSHLELTIDPEKTRHFLIGTPSFGALYADSMGEQAKVDLLACSLTLLDRFADMYKGLDGFLELYRPIQEIFRKVNVSDLCEPLQVFLLFWLPFFILHPDKNITSETRLRRRIYDWPVIKIRTAVTSFPHSANA
jgi:nucleolar protein 14